MIRYIQNWQALGVVALSALLLSGCYNDKSVRNIEFAPNMYNSIPLEPYSQTVMSSDSGKVKLPWSEPGLAYANGLSAQPTPKGTLPRAESWYRKEAYMPYHIPNTPEGYEQSASLASPISDSTTNDAGMNCTEASYNRGKVLYERFCTMCHGPNGLGKGILVTKGTQLGIVPAYNSPTLIDLPAGKMYHTLTYGKNNMGSYASQLTPLERWEVICYIQHFQQ